MGGVTEVDSISRSPVEQLYGGVSLDESFFVSQKWIPFPAVL